MNRKFRFVIGTDLEKPPSAKRIGEDYDLVLTDRATCFRDETFDAVAFNPPYLPSTEIVDRAVDGGKNGLEVPLAFLSEALRVSKHGSQIVMILSNESQMDGFAEFCKAHYLSWKVLLEKNLFFEKLIGILVLRKDVMAHD